MSSTAGARHRAELPAGDGHVLESLQLSVAGLEARAPQLVLVLHEQLLARAPGTARLPGAGRPVARRLVEALLHATAVDDRGTDAVGLLRRIGAENRLDGFAPDNDQFVRQVLLQAVRTVHRGAWSEPLSSGWGEYILWLEKQLAAGASEVIRLRALEPVPSPALDQVARASGW